MLAVSVKVDTVLMAALPHHIHEGGTMSIKNIVFDIGGVLADNNVHGFL